MTHPRTQELYTVFYDYDRNPRFRKWLDKAELYRKRRNGELYDDDTKRVIESYGIQEVGVNIFQSIIESRMGVFGSLPTHPSAISTGDSDEARLISYVAQSLITGIFQNVKWDQTYSRILDDEFTIGAGAAVVEPSDNIFGSTISYLDPIRVRWDEVFTSFQMEDCDCVIVYSLLTKKAAIRKYRIPNNRDIDAVAIISEFPDVYSKIESFQEFRSSEESSLVGCIEVMYKEFQNYEKLLFYDELTKSERSELIPVNDKNDPEIFDKDYGALGNAYSYFYHLAGGKVKHEDASTYAKNRVEEVKRGMIMPLKQKRTIKETCVGGYYVGKEVLPSKDYPVVMFFNELAQHSMPRGVLEPVKTMIDTVNTSMVLHILNAFLTVNSPVLVPNSAIRNLEEFTFQASQPSAAIPYDPVPVGYGGAFVKPEILQRGNPNLTMERVITQLLELIKYVSNTPDILSGQQGVETFRTNAALQNASVARLRHVASRNEHSIAKLAQVIFEYSRVLCDKNAKLRYMEKDDLLMQAIEELSKKVYGKDVSRKYIGTDLNYELPINKESVETEIDESGEPVEKKVIYNNIANFEVGVDFIITTSPQFETMKERVMAQLELVIERSGDPTTSRYAATKLLGLMEHPLAKQMAVELDSLNQMQSQIDGLNQQLKHTQAEKLSLSKMVERSEISKNAARKLADLSVKINKTLADIEANKQIYMERLKQGDETMFAEMEASMKETVNEFGQVLKEFDNGQPNS
jgi:hypothetical protein